MRKKRSEGRERSFLLRIPETGRGSIFGAFGIGKGERGRELAEECRDYFLLFSLSSYSPELMECEIGFMET